MTAHFKHSDGGVGVGDVEGVGVLVEPNAAEQMDANSKFPDL